MIIVENEDAACDECLSSTKLVYMEYSEIFICQNCLIKALQFICDHTYESVNDVVIKCTKCNHIIASG